MSSLMPRLDRFTRAFWRAAGRPVDLAGEHAWLDANPEAGLLGDMAALNGPGFAAADLRPEVRDFYERTGRWRLEVWTQWSPVFQPGGELVSRLFGRRVEHLALPTRPLDVAHGMDSRVTVLTDGTGQQQAAAGGRVAAHLAVHGGVRLQRLLLLTLVARNRPAQRARDLPPGGGRRLGVPPVPRAAGRRPGARVPVRAVRR
jgi:hypothetical protein